jgi:glycosyltransferase involved in cell wall biosynthesis
VLPYDAEPQARGDHWLYRVRNVASRNFYATVGAERRHIRQWIDRSGAAVLLSHFGHIGLRMLPVARELNLPLVVHFHGMDLSSMLHNRWYRWSLVNAIPSFHAMIVVGRHQRQRLLALGGDPTRIHLIPCGVPADQFQAVARPPSPQVIRYICVCRLQPFKGVDYVIRAFWKVLRHGVHAHLDIIGDGGYRAALERLSQDLDLGPHITFHGFQPNREVRRRLAASDVYVQHSLEDPSGWIEGFGVSVAEAAATGLPVVVTRTGGIVDQVIDGRTGILVEQRNVPSTAEAMRKLALDPEMRLRMGLAASDHVRSRFDTARQIRRLEDVLLTALA